MCGMCAGTNHRQLSTIARIPSLGTGPGTLFEYFPNTLDTFS